MTIHITRKHGLGQAAAKERIDGIADGLRDKLAVKAHWEGDTLLFERRGASGRIRVDDGDIDIQVELGIMLRGLKGAIVDSINEQMDSALS